MRYPAISASKANEIARLRLAGADIHVAPYVTWLGVPGDDVSLTDLAALGTRLDQGIAAGEALDSDRDRYEGSNAVALYEACSALPGEAINDPGFWRYVGLAHFWNFICWREAVPIGNGNIEKYLSAESPTEAVLTRMYIRGAALGGRQHAELGGTLEKATDFWRSHVIRVRTGTAPPVTRALVRSQAEARMMTDELRAFARNLNRMWTNVHPKMLEEMDANALIDEVRSWGEGDD